jgi:hypothetical protein
MHFRPFILTLMLLTAFSGLVGGCAVIDLPDKLDLDESKAKPERPVKMTAMWTDTVLVEAGVVGFGGRRRPDSSRRRVVGVCLRRHERRRRKPDAGT